MPSEKIVSLVPDPPIICKGVLLDAVGLKGVTCLPEAYEITIGDIEDCLVRQMVIPRF